MAFEAAADEFFEDELEDWLDLAVAEDEVCRLLDEIPAVCDRDPECRA